MDQKPRPHNMIWIAGCCVLAALLGWIFLQPRIGTASGMDFPRGRMEIQRADGSKAAFDVEVATTPAQQEYGLMFRKSLAPHAGMIFIWAYDQPVAMWMKNTLIPLDMLFVGGDGHIVKIAANAVPEDLTPISSDFPTRAVVEIGGGEAQKQNIKVGDLIAYPGLGKN